MRARVFVFCLVLATVSPLAAADVALDGSWTGWRNGTTVSWQLSDDGRLRMDGRGADYVVSGDSLLVTFDSVDPGAKPETAIYRFTPEDGVTRLFVYGFDLGRQGVVLSRVRPAEPEEDTSAPPPSPGPPGNR